MKWVTRERARVDRIACPWLITRFIDPTPEFLFVPSDKVRDVAKRENATPYDIPDVELGHHGPHCSFDAFIERYELADPALAVGAALKRGVVGDHELTVPGGVDVQLEHVRLPALDGSPERREGVLGGEQRSASVGDVEGRAQALEEGMAHGRGESPLFLRPVLEHPRTLWKDGKVAPGDCSGPRFECPR